jgi:hypothetical protein
LNDRRGRWLAAAKLAEESAASCEAADKADCAAE